MAQVIRMKKIRVAAVAVAVFALAAAAGAGPVADDRLPDLSACPELAVPDGNQVSFQADGVGVQIYQWDGAKWAFVAPEATLFHANAVVATHFGGPSWKSNSGSLVVGTVDRKCSPDPDSIPWLRLFASHTEGPGIFADTTFVQRLNTVGGLAPDEPGDFVGEVARVPYAADYVFYRKQ